MRYFWRLFFSAVLLVLLGVASCAAPRDPTSGPNSPLPATSSTHATTIGLTNSVGK